MDIRLVSLLRRVLQRFQQRLALARRLPRGILVLWAAFKRLLLGYSASKDSPRPLNDPDSYTRPTQSTWRSRDTTFNASADPGVAKEPFSVEDSSTSLPRDHTFDAVPMTPEPRLRSLEPTQSLHQETVWSQGGLGQDRPEILAQGGSGRCCPSPP